MIQPATLRQESSGGQQNSTYFNRGASDLVLMLKFQMLMVKIQMLMLKFRMMMVKIQMLMVKFRMMMKFQTMTLNFVIPVFQVHV
jgi:hypothetical protein